MDQYQQELKNFLDQLLGPGKGTDTALLYFCPFHEHHRKKLAIDVAKRFYHCWVCDRGSKSMYGLLKEMEVPSTTYHQLTTILKKYPDYEAWSSGKVFQGSSDSTPKQGCDSLPKEFIPLSKQKTSFTYTRAINYLGNRGFGIEDIQKHNIGMCVSGKYSDRIIVPSYDKDDQINYFVARDMSGMSSMKYLNPRISKNIIVFESFISWRLPVVFVEGVFDAIAVRRNAIPLLGKMMNDEIRKNLLIHKPDCAYIALDQDAFKNTLNLAQELINFRVTPIVVTLGEKDPADLGFEDFWKNVDMNSKVFSEDDLFMGKISLE